MVEIVMVLSEAQQIGTMHGLPSQFSPGTKTQVFVVAIFGCLEPRGVRGQTSLAY